MKRNLIVFTLSVLLMAVFGISANAKDDSSLNIQGLGKKAITLESFKLTKNDKKTPRDVCRRINDDNQKLQCMRISRRHYYSQASLNFCDQLVNASTTVRCMRTLGDQELSNDAQRVCARIKDDNEAISCVVNAMNNYYDRAAIDFCDQLKTSTATTRCMGITANERMQDNAAKACARIKDDNQALSCASTIVGRYYSRQHVQDCDSMRTASATIECFRY